MKVMTVYMLYFYVLIQRLELGTIQRSVYHKDTWTRQYIHFNGFAPIQEWLPSVS